MKCFIASAFGHDDVDAIYDHAVLPVLTDLDIKPSRVDRHEHNDDIDDKIFELLDAADLCIADLTYARPSVYYEAGYAFASGKPVIYTTRSDHFVTKHDDPEGNRRVHFDLQMKNIIAWTNPNDTFRKRLKKRIRYVTAPMRRAREALEAERERVRQFASRSHADRVQVLLSDAESSLHSLGFSVTERDDPRTTVREVDSTRVLRRTVAELQQVTIAVLPSLTKTSLSKVATGARAYHVVWRPVVEDRPDIENSWRSYLILYTFKPVRSDTIARSLEHFVPIGDKLYRRSFEHTSSKNAQHECTVVVIDRVESREEAADRLRATLDDLRLVALPTSKKGQKRKRVRSE